MATDHIRYDILAQQALRGVVRTVLADAAKKDRDALLCQLNSYARPSQEVVA